MFTRKDEPFKVARISTGQGPGQAIGVYAFPASEMGIPTVGIDWRIDDQLSHMTPETAEELADALKKAARVARVGRN